MNRQYAHRDVHHSKIQKPQERTVFYYKGEKNSETKWYAKMSDISFALEKPR